MCRIEHPFLAFNLSTFYVYQAVADSDGTEVNEDRVTLITAACGTGVPLQPCEEFAYCEDGTIYRAYDQCCCVPEVNYDQKTRNKRGVGKPIKQLLGGITDVVDDVEEVTDDVVGRTRLGKPIDQLLGGITEIIDDVDDIVPP